MCESEYYLSRVCCAMLWKQFFFFLVRWKSNNGRTFVMQLQCMEIHNNIWENMLLHVTCVLVGNTVHYLCEKNKCVSVLFVISIIRCTLHIEFYSKRIFLKIYFSVFIFSVFVMCLVPEVMLGKWKIQFLFFFLFLEWMLWITSHKNEENFNQLRMLAYGKRKNNNVVKAFFVVLFRVHTSIWEFEWMCALWFYCYCKLILFIYFYVLSIACLLRFLSKGGLQCYVVKNHNTYLNSMVYFGWSGSWIWSWY